MRHSLYATVWKPYGNRETPQHRPHVPPLADPRDRRRLQARGRLGAARLRDRRGVRRGRRLAGLRPRGRHDSTATRVLWAVRDLLGKWFGLGRIAAAQE